MKKEFMIFKFKNIRNLETFISFVSSKGYIYKFSSNTIGGGFFNSNTEDNKVYVFNKKDKGPLQDKDIDILEFAYEVFDDTIDITDEIINNYVEAQKDVVDTLEDNLNELITTHNRLLTSRRARLFSYIKKVTKSISIGLMSGYTISLLLVSSRHPEFNANNLFFSLLSTTFTSNIFFFFSFFCILIALIVTSPKEDVIEIKKEIEIDIINEAFKLKVLSNILNFLRQ